MIIAIKTGVSLCTTLVGFDLTGASNIYKCILITVQMAITPIVISGLVKGSDAITARMFQEGEKSYGANEQKCKFGRD